MSKQDESQDEPQVTKQTLKRDFRQFYDEAITSMTDGHGLGDYGEAAQLAALGLIVHGLNRIEGRLKRIEEAVWEVASR